MDLIFAAICRIALVVLVLHFVIIGLVSNAFVRSSFSLQCNVVFLTTKFGVSSHAVCSTLLLPATLNVGLCRCQLEDAQRRPSPASKTLLSSLLDHFFPPPLPPCFSSACPFSACLQVVLTSTTLGSPIFDMHTDTLTACYKKDQEAM